MLEQELIDLPPPERLLALHKQGRVIRNKWRGLSETGMETACLYSALVPGASGTNGCPAWLMPQWLADLIPGIDDCGTSEAWPAMVERFGRVVSVMGNLTPEAERRILAKTILAALTIASSHNYEACFTVIALWERELAGDPPRLQEWQAEHVAQRALREARVASWTTRASWASRAAANAAAAAVAVAEVGAASWKTSVALSLAARAAGESTWGAEELARDQITDAILAAIEAEA